DMNAALYKWQSVEDLEKILVGSLVKYSCSPSASSPSAIEFIQKLSSDQEKVCRAHTAKHFTAKTVASSRAEGSNSRIKEKGTKKAELRKYNLLEFLEHYSSIVERQEN